MPLNPNILAVPRSEKPEPKQGTEIPRTEGGGNLYHEKGSNDESLKGKSDPINNDVSSIGNTPPEMENSLHPAEQHQGKGKEYCADNRSKQRASTFCKVGPARHSVRE